MEPIRVLFIDMPTIVREMLSQAVAADPQLVIEGEVSEGKDALEVLARLGGGVVLVGDRRLGDHMIGDLLRQAPASVLLAVDASGDGLDLYELQPRRVRLGEASPQRVVEVIREVGGARRTG